MPMRKIVILHSEVAPDAAEDELDCLRQAKTIAETVTALGDAPILLPFVLDLSATMAKLALIKPDMVFNLVETVAARGSMAYFAPALLDVLRIPYTGSRTAAMFLTSSKPLAKKMLAANGIATPNWIAADETHCASGRPCAYLIKPCWEDASVGLDEEAFLPSADAETALRALRERQKKLNLECFAEAYIDGREFNIALLAVAGGVIVLPPAEILFLNYPPDKLKMLDYRAKWVEDSFEYENTVRTLKIKTQDAGLADRLRETALACWRLFGLRGYARIDFRVDAQGQPWVLEINANPCLSPDAGFAAALEHAGIPYSEAIDNILHDALNP